MTELQKAEKKIRNAWIAAFVSAGITLIIILLSLGGNELIKGINAWGIVDVIFASGLAFGIMKKSRACAVILFIYFIINKIYLWVLAGNVSGWWIALLFLFFFFEGIEGTFYYHKLSENKKSSVAEGFCSECGKIIENKTNFCKHCGAKIIKR